MKNLLLKLISLILVISTALFIATACNNDDFVASEGLEFEMSSDRTGYAVIGIGECFDRKVVIPLTYNDKPVIEIKEEAFKEDPFIEEVIITNNVTTLGNRAFSGCYSLTTITIPNNVLSIGKGAFNNCRTDIKWGDNPRISEIANSTFVGYYGFSIVIPSSVTSIGDSAFENCSNLTSVTIPNGVVSIGSIAFMGCENLTYVTIPSSVTSIGANAFRGCAMLTGIKFEDVSTWYYTDSNYNFTNKIFGEMIDVNNDSDNATLFKDNGNIYYYYKI